MVRVDSCWRGRTIPVGTSQVPRSSRDVGAHGALTFDGHLATEKAVIAKPRENNGRLEHVARYGVHLQEVTTKWCIYTMKRGFEMVETI